MPYCPEDIKFNLSYTLHSNFTHETSEIDPNVNFYSPCESKYPLGLNQNRNFELHYAGEIQLSDGRTFDHVWTGVVQNPNQSPVGSTFHYLFKNGNNELALYIEDHNDPLLQNHDPEIYNSFFPYSGNVVNETTIPDFVFGSCNEDSDGNLLSACVAGDSSMSQWLRVLIIDGNQVVLGADQICRQYISPTITQIGSCCCPTTFTVYAGREYKAHFVTPQRLEVQIIPYYNYLDYSHYPGGVIVSYASESQAEQFCSDSANYADPVDISAAYFYSTISPGCSAALLTRTINSTPTVYGPCLSMVDGSTFWTISSYSITYSCEAGGDPGDPGDPGGDPGGGGGGGGGNPCGPIPVVCHTVNGSYSTSQKISVCDIDQEDASEKFDALVPNGAINITKTHTQQVSDPETNEYSYEIPIFDDFFDKTVLAEELVKALNNICYYNNLLTTTDFDNLKIYEHYLGETQRQPTWSAAPASWGVATPGYAGGASTIGVGILTKDVENLTKDPYFDQFCKNTKGLRAESNGTQENNLSDLVSRVKRTKFKLVFVKDPDNDKLLRGYLIEDTASGAAVLARGGYSPYSILGNSSGTGSKTVVDAVKAYLGQAENEVKKLKKILNIKDLTQLDICSTLANLKDQRNSVDIVFPHVYPQLTYTITIEYDKTTEIPDSCRDSLPVTTSHTKTVTDKTFEAGSTIIINGFA